MDMINAGGMRMITLFKRLGVVRLTLVTLTAVAVALLFMLREVQAPAADGAARAEITPAPAAEALETGEKILPGCQIVQTMGFSRCGHSVTRRISAPDGLTGSDFAAVQRYYEMWHIDAFAPDSVVMTREIPLYCPMHWVLAANEAGEIVLTRNLYGDGMAAVENLGGSLSAFPLSVREELIVGKGFDSGEEAKSWLKEVSESAPDP